MSNLFNLKDKTILVTGSAGHIGFQITKSLLEYGAVVYANTRTEKKFEDIEGRLSSKLKKRLRKAVFDLKNKLEIDNFFDEIPKNEINVLINNAHVRKSGGTEFSDSSDFDEAFELSVTIPNYIFKKNLSNNSSLKSVTSVVNIASMYGHVSPKISNYENPKDVNPPFYGASKAALIHWTRYIATEFGNRGIRSNSISPGAFPENISKELENNLKQSVPLGRLGKASEICGAVIFLASDASLYVNGADIRIDGGWTCW